MNLRMIKSWYKDVPIMALTGTATDNDITQIVSILNLQNAKM